MGSPNGPIQITGNAAPVQNADQADPILLMPDAGDGELVVDHRDIHRRTPLVHRVGVQDLDLPPTPAPLGVQHPTPQAGVGGDHADVHQQNLFRRGLLEVLEQVLERILGGGLGKNVNGRRGGARHHSADFAGDETVQVDIRGEGTLPRVRAASEAVSELVQRNPAVVRRRCVDDRFESIGATGADDHRRSAHDLLTGEHSGPSVPDLEPNVAGIGDQIQMTGGTGRGHQAQQRLGRQMGQTPGQHSFHDASSLTT
jgi:hypothetical protein